MTTNHTRHDATAEALVATLISPNEADRNLEPANVVDGLFAIARAIQRLARAVEGRAGSGDADLSLIVECRKCGMEYTATAAQIIAGIWRKACPQCYPPPKDEPRPEPVDDG
jgi:hypothetical protein